MDVCLLLIALSLCLNIMSKSLATSMYTSWTLSKPGHRSVVRSTYWSKGCYYPLRKFQLNDTRTSVWISFRAFVKLGKEEENVRKAFDGIKENKECTRKHTPLFAQNKFCYDHSIFPVPLLLHSSKPRQLIRVVYISLKDLPGTLRACDDVLETSVWSVTSTLTNLAWNHDGDHYHIWV